MGPQRFRPVVDKASHERLSAGKLAVNAESEQHDEKESRPQGRRGEGEDDFRIDKEGQARSALHNVANFHPLRVSHVAEDGEDDRGGEEAGEGVDRADEEGVPVAVVVELVVAAQGKKSSNANSIRVEDLSASIWEVGINAEAAISLETLFRAGKGSFYREIGLEREEKRELTNPDLGLPQSLPLGCKQELESIGSTLEKKYFNKSEKKTKMT